MAPGPPSKWPTVSSRDESDRSSPGLDERRRRRWCRLFRLLFLLLRWAVLRRFRDERSRRRRRLLGLRELVGEERDLERERERLFFLRDLSWSRRSHFGLRLLSRRLSTLLLLELRRRLRSFVDRLRLCGC